MGAPSRLLLLVFSVVVIVVLMELGEVSAAASLSFSALKCSEERGPDSLTYDRALAKKA